MRWLFFNIAAPTPDASHYADAKLRYGGDFEPALASYLTSPVSAGLIVVFGAMVVAIVLPRFRTKSSGNANALLLALLAYALLRAVFFAVLNPGECLLFSASVTLAHLLLIAVLFAASSFPAKGVLLAAFAALLFLANGAFIVGSRIWLWA